VYTESWHIVTAGFDVSAHLTGGVKHWKGGVPMQLGKRSSLELLMTVVLGVGGLCLLLSSLPMDSSPLSSAAWPAVYAQTPLTVTLDGLGDDWTDPAWRLITDTLDVSIAGNPNCGGSLGNHPHDAPCFARTGYDITAIWGYYRILDDSWYFRLDVDGVPGDSDSITGTDATALGYGTSGHDSGALHEGNDLDPDGLGSVGGVGEEYILQFGPAEGTVAERAELLDDQGPGQVFTLSPPESTVSGEAVYSTTVDPGIIEWRIDKTSLLDALGAPSELWMRVFADSDLDVLGEDRINDFLVLGIDIANICPTPFVVGAEATFPISYSIISTSTYPLASNVTITAPVPAGTTYVGCSGGVCLESGGVISWSLGTLPRGTEGVVYFNAVGNVDTGITTEAFISIAEGLSDETSATGCTAVQPPPPSTPTPTPVPPPPEDEDEAPPPPPPPPIPTFTPMPSPTASPTPVFPSYLPETGESAKDVVWLGLALLVGALLGSGILLRRQL